MTYIDSSFIFGFIAGEGCFSANFKQNPSARHGLTPNIVFKVTLNECDEEVLRKIHEQVSLGKITLTNDGTVTWYIDTYDGREDFIDWMEKNMQQQFRCSAKYDSYRRWKHFHKNWGYHDRKSPDELKEFIDMSMEINPEGRDFSRSRQKLHNMVEA